jgi:hypothetical protein
VIVERARDEADTGRAVAELRLPGPRPVLVLIGGAAGLDERPHDRLASLFAEVIAPALARHGAAAVDGGTASGVMLLLGLAHADNPTFPLVGVAAEGTVAPPGTTPLDRNHTHFVLVPGDQWGAESPYLPLVARALAAGGPTVTLLVNGGDITLDDALRSVDEGIPVLVLSGTGRAADQIAAAVAAHSPRGDDRIARLAVSDAVRVLPLDNRNAIAHALELHLAR